MMQEENFETKNYRWPSVHNQLVLTCDSDVHLLLTERLRRADGELCLGADRHKSDARTTNGHSGGVDGVMRGHPLQAVTYSVQHVHRGGTGAQVWWREGCRLSLVLPAVLLHTTSVSIMPTLSLYSEHFPQLRKQALMISMLWHLSRLWRLNSNQVLDCTALPFTFTFQCSHTPPSLLSLE